MHIHTIFRFPGFIPRAIGELKVEALSRQYAQWHAGIDAIPERITVANIERLAGFDFVFVSVDDGSARRVIVDWLSAKGITYVDCGMGLDLTDGTLGGILRVTASTPNARDRIRRHVSFAGGGAVDVYASNIQVADLNALNAIMAVVKWKKLRGFYRDLEGELHSTYTTDGNLLLNEEKP